MSIDLKYYSFNTKRADERWKDFPEEILDIEDLISVDISYGGISNASNDLFDDGKMVNAIMENVLLSDFDIESVEGTPSSICLVKFYESLDKEKLLKFYKLVSEIFECDEEDGKAYATDFLLGLKPIVKDLKDNPDSIFVESINGDISPKSAFEILRDRAVEHSKIK